MIKGQVSYLGNQLIKLGKITPDELDRALLEQKSLKRAVIRDDLGKFLWIWDTALKKT